MGRRALRALAKLMVRLGGGEAPSGTFRLQRNLPPRWLQGWQCRSGTRRLRTGPGPTGVIWPLVTYRSPNAQAAPPTASPGLTLNGALKATLRLKDFAREVGSWGELRRCLDAAEKMAK